ncbi:MAG: hypothetical protein RLZZ175_2748 [Bacteroidota bacterium]|jgi:hypothetical protein
MKTETILIITGGLILVASIVAFAIIYTSKDDVSEKQAMADAEKAKVELAKQLGINDNSTGGIIKSISGGLGGLGAGVASLFGGGLV